MAVKTATQTVQKFQRASLRQIIRYFSVDLDAYRVAQLITLNRYSVNHNLRVIRKRIAEFCETQSPFSGEIEADESFFGARRITRDRGASGKTIVFGILKYNGKVLTEIVPDCSKAMLQAVIRGYKGHSRQHHPLGRRAWLQ